MTTIREDQDPVQLRHWTKLYIEWMESRRKSVESTRAYGGTLYRLADWLEDNPRPLTVSTIEAYCGRVRRSGQRPTAATYNRDLAAIRGLYKYLLSHHEDDPDYPQFDIARGVAKLDSKHDDQDEADARTRIIPDRTWQAVWYSPMSREDRVMLGFAYYAGLRCSEIGNLKPEQVDVERQRLIRFRRKGSKRSTVEYGKLARLVQAKLPGLGLYIDDWLANVEWLATARQGEQRLMSRSDPNQVTHDWPRRDLSNLQAAVGMERFEFRMHDMRRTCATNLARCGMTLGAIRDILSHSSETTTLLYADMEVELDRLLDDTEER